MRVWFPILVRLIVVAICVRLALMTDDPATLTAASGIALFASGWELARWVR